MLKKAMILIIIVLMATTAMAQWSSETKVKPRGVTIATLGEGETVYVGALQVSPRRLFAASWIRIYASEDLTVTFNGGPVLLNTATEDILSNVGDADYSVTDAVPITANEWHIIKCSATLLTLTDCDAGSATIIAEYE